MRGLGPGFRIAHRPDLVILRALSIPAVKPSLEEFHALAEQGNVVPVYAQLAADFETPLSAFLKIRDGKHAFLLESAESTDASGRWSIVGSGPRRIFEARGKEVRIRRGSEDEVLEAGRYLLGELEKLTGGYRPVTHGDAQPFFGVSVGCLAYDAVRPFHPTIEDPPPDVGLAPDIDLLGLVAVLVNDQQVAASALQIDHDRGLPEFPARVVANLGARRNRHHGDFLTSSAYDRRASKCECDAQKKH